MTTLLIHAPVNNTAPSDKTMFGGQPSAPAGALEWPTCACCDGPMQFLGQIRTAAQELLLLFMCQNDPDGCEEWDPYTGGNKVIVVDTADLQCMTAPPSGQTTRDTRYSAQLLQTDKLDYNEARAQWASANGQSPREVLDQIGGTPAWLHDEETPDCQACGNPMPFVAQLEEGPDYRFEMNFGGGCAYVFRCGCHLASAKLLWQC